MALAIGVMTSLFFGIGWLYSWQQRSYDFFFQAAPRSAEPDGQIIIIGIDEMSLEKLGRISEWTRSNYTRVLDSLSKAKSRVVIFDVLLSEPAVGDEDLSSSIRNAGNVVLPLVVSEETANIPAVERSAENGDFVRPIATFSNEAAVIGHANIIPDSGGVVRRLPIALGTGASSEPSLALAGAAKYLRLPEVVQPPIESGGLQFAGRFIPLSDDQEMLVNYLNKLDEVVNFRVVSFLDVLEGNVGLNLFQDKIVLIGAMASGLGDTYWTPVGAMSRVWLHASAIHTILAADFIEPVPGSVTIALILIFSIAVGFFVMRFVCCMLPLSPFCY